MGRKSSSRTSSNARENIKTKEDLIVYLKTVEELPFLEELWDLCVEKAKENEGKEVPMVEKTYKDKDGNMVTKRRVGGALITNPVSYYFKMFKLPHYRRKALDLKDYQERLDDDQSEIMDTYFDDGEENKCFNEITRWIDMFPSSNERQYLKQRYASYYDNYEINDGADRVSLTRILSLEIELYRINVKRAKSQPVDINQEDKLTKMLRDTLESMKWTKKQRSAQDDMAQNKFSIFMDKQVKNGKFTPEHHEIPKDEIDMLIDIIPKAVAKMFD